MKPCKLTVSDQASAQQALQWLKAEGYDQTAFYPNHEGGEDFIINQLRGSINAAMQKENQLSLGITPELQPVWGAVVVIVHADKTKDIIQSFAAAPINASKLLPLDGMDGSIIARQIENASSKKLNVEHNQLSDKEIKNKIPEKENALPDAELKKIPPHKIYIVTGDLIEATPEQIIAAKQGQGDKELIKAVQSPDARIIQGQLLKIAMKYELFSYVN